MRRPRKVSGRRADEAAAMHTNTTYPAPPSVDLATLGGEIAAMYRDVANETARDLHFPTGRRLADALGYPAELLDRLPAGAVTSFAGVGYHFGLARLLPGERVLDLGSGSGMDAFAAAEQVGPQGSVTGVDITPEQLAKARRLDPDRGTAFLHARIEALPFEDGSFDAVISNGVINLSPDKPAAFAEAARVLRPGGRLAISDIVTDRPIVARTVAKADLWAACIAGASQRNVYVREIAAAGLDLEISVENPAYGFISERAQRTSAKYGARSISLLAVKPSDANSHINTDNQEVSQ
jgi:arsenite methyltransferase